MKRLISFICFFLFLTTQHTLASYGRVPIKDLARIEGVRDNALVGYGIVVGLAGSGDSPRSKATLQSIRNTLENFGLILSVEDINSKNVAAVIITADLPPFAQPGDKINVHVSSIGDARSLAGGTLFMTPLKAADNDIYALAQGVLTVGGYKFESNQNLLQKNHPTVGYISQGATVEKEVSNSFVSLDGSLNLVLKKPDFIMAERIASALKKLGDYDVEAIHAGKIKITPTTKTSAISMIAKIQSTLINPPAVSKIIINEKTGTVVAGANVEVGNVVISHSGLKLTIDTKFNVSQPNSFLRTTGDGIRTAVVPETKIEVLNEHEALYRSGGGTNISDLIDSLKLLKLSTRDIISILQSLKQSGALHAEIVVQ